MSVFDLRERLMPKLPGVQAEPVHVPAQAGPPVIVTEGTHKLTLTTPVEEFTSEAASDMAKRLFLRLRGRFVEAEKANGNGAFWSARDLEVGLPTVATGPLNWLHEERRIVGALSDAHLVQREAAAASGLGPHITADAVLWRWLYPQEARIVERAADERKLWYSMECVSPEVACVGDNGCGAQVPYLDALQRSGAACQHMRERSASRRFVDPVFQGGAIIVPPVTPGWASADLTVVREAASALESTPWLSQNLSDEEATAMVQQVLSYANDA